MSFTGSIPRPGPVDRVLTGGLGGVFNRSINPTAFVRGQICRIVNWPEQEYKMFNETWREPVRDSIVYIGSTTGTSYDNFRCSPAEVSWHVDRECCILSAQNMDRLCADLLEYGRNMEGDVQPGTISSSCCTLHLRHQRLVHCQLLLHVSWETIFDRRI